MSILHIRWVSHRAAVEKHEFSSERGVVPVTVSIGVTSLVPGQRPVEPGALEPALGVGPGLHDQ